MGTIYYLMGKSASGKDSVFKELKRRLPDIKEIIPYTTRPIRKNEVDGVEYHFVDDAFLDILLEKKQVIELRTYNTQYGIWKYFMADTGQIDLKTSSYLAIGTLDSYAAIRNYFGEGHIVPLYITVEDGLRLSRAIERERQQINPKYTELCRRFLADTKDFSDENLRKMGITHQFINNDFETCINEIINYIIERKYIKE